MENLVERMTKVDVVKEAPDVHVPQQRSLPQKWLVCPQRPEEIQHLCRADGFKHMFFAAPYILLYAVAVYLQFIVDNVWGNIALSFLIGNQLYLMFILHHDCMHGTAFRNDFFNRLMGRLYAVTFTMTFTVNRQTHMRHHAYVSDPERDPDEYYFAGTLSQIWFRLWRYYEWYTRIALTRYGKGVRNTVLIEQGTNLAIWALVHVVLFSMGIGLKAVYIFWLPLAVVALVINPFTRGYEHSPLTLYPQGDPRRRDMSKNTITVANRWLGWWWANITYHVEHHAYPRCPFYNLQKVYRIFQEEKMQYLTAPFPMYRVWHGKRMLETMTSNTAAAG